MRTWSCCCPATATAPSSTTSKARSLNARHPDLASLLAAHGLERATEEPLAHAGFSGAHITRLVRADGASFVLKRMSIERDWIMRATDDRTCREAAFAAAAPILPSAIRTPTVGVARDGGGHALLMTDITVDLILPGSSTISIDQLQRIIDAMAALHATMPPEDVPWCGLEQRLTLLTPAGAAIAADYGNPVARDITEGWRLFDRHAPRDAVALIRGLFEDPSPLLRALDALPACLLHGDLKLDNIGLDGAGRMWLIDWAMTMVAPAAVDLGWFLAINSRRLPVSLDEVIARYDTAPHVADLERHDALTVLCGLLLRGWRKALDAETGEPDELRWWCERARDATDLL